MKRTSFPLTTTPDRVSELIDRNRLALHEAVAVLNAERPESLGIVGAGLMGAAIAAEAVRHGLPVVLADSSPAALAAAEQRIVQELGNAAIQRLFRTTADVAETARCGVVLESVVEDAGIKQDVCAVLEPHVDAHAILATNTSTIPIAQLAGSLARPERFCGVHFFHPVGERPLVEIVRGAATEERTVLVAMTLAEALGKMAIVVQDGPGFLVNRLLLPYLTEAMELLLDGVPIDRVERAATEFGMAKGPLRLLDEIGLDTALAGGRVLWQAFGDRVVVSPLAIAMYKAKRFGCKSGAGFFNYTQSADDGNPPTDSVALEKIRHWARPTRALDDETIVARLLLPMVLEATRVLDEGKVSDPGDVDLGAVFGLGFPAARGGLLGWADTLGAARIIEMLAALEDLGPRAQPTPLLRRMAAQGTK